MNEIKKYQSPQSSGYVAIIENEIENLKKLVTIFKNSHYNTAFLEPVTTTDKDGKSTTTLVVNEDDMLSTMITGMMIGFNPIESLGLGKTLDQHAIAKVERGSRLGLSKYQSLEQIDIFTSKEGKSMLIIRANVIEGILQANDIDIEVIDNCKLIYKFINPATRLDIKEEDIIKNPDKYIEFDQKIHTQDVLIKKVKEGFIFYVKEKSDLVTTVRMTRIKNGRTIIKTHTVTLQDTINWGFMKGVTSDGRVIEKSRTIWEARYPQMAMKTAIANCGRRIANDLIEGIYSYEELGFNKETKHSDIENEILKGNYANTVIEDIIEEQN